MRLLNLPRNQKTLTARLRFHFFHELSDFSRMILTFLSLIWNLSLNSDLNPSHLKKLYNIVLSVTPRRKSLERNTHFVPIELLK